MQSEQIDSSDRAVRPPIPPWWPKIEQDYFAVHERWISKRGEVFSEEGRMLRRRTIGQGAELVRQILDLVDAAEPIPAVRDAAVRYLPNRVYQDLGTNYFDQRDRAHVARQAVRRLERLGYRVSLTEGAA